MKIKLSELHKLINEAIREQVQPEETLEAFEDEPVSQEDEQLQNVEDLFGYIKQQLEDKNFVMAKRFIDNLKIEVEEMEKRQAGLDAVQDTE